MNRSFDWLATPYAALERLFFGSAFQRLRERLAQSVDGARSVLVLGEGDGRFAEALLRRNRDVRVTLVDASARMLSRARRRISPWQDRVVVVHADVVEWLRLSPPTQAFDAVVTTYFLDCLTERELTALFDSVGGQLRPGASWLWADFVVPRHGLRRPLAGALLALLYWSFRLTTNITARRLTDPYPYFQRRAWVPGAASHSLAGLLRSCVWTRSYVSSRPLRSSPTVLESPPTAAARPTPAT